VIELVLAIQVADIFSKQLQQMAPQAQRRPGIPEGFSGSRPRLGSTWNVILDEV
jgi:hypothetical protein